jgi:hypothetical protein
MLQDGICRVRDGYYTKTIEYDDINYSVASNDDQAAIFDGYCGFLNYFDSALPFQMSFINHRSRANKRYTVNIPKQQSAADLDEYDPSLTEAYEPENDYTAEWDADSDTDTDSESGDEE